MNVSGTDSPPSDTQNLNGSASFLEKVRSKISYKSSVEYGIAVIIVCLAFVMSAYHFSQQSVQSLVPFSSLSSCSSYSEVFSLVPQTVDVSYPATVIFVDYATDIVAEGYSNVTFSAKWSSCLQESIDNNFHLTPEISDYYEAIVLTNLSDIIYRFNGSSSTNNGCFRLFCGLEWLWVGEHNPRKEYSEFLSDSIFMMIPDNRNIYEQYQNGTKDYVNSQLITSISGTNNSVTASCAVSVGGYYLQTFTQSNSITATGTYLCTQKTGTLQALSSGLSIALGAIGVCRMYFLGKKYFKQL